MVLRERIELSTSPLPRECSTTELPQPADAADFCHIRRASARRVLTATTWLDLAPRRGHNDPCFSRKVPVFRQVGTGDMTSGDGSREKAKRPDRKARLAEELRANLQRRKAQTSSRRTGGADERPEGLAAADRKPAGEG